MHECTLQNSAIYCVIGSSTPTLIVALTNGLQSTLYIALGYGYIRTHMYMYMNKVVLLKTSHTNVHGVIAANLI